MAAVNARAAMLNPQDPTDPETIARASTQLQSEIADKREATKNTAALQQAKIRGIDANSKAAQERLDQGWARLSASQAATSRKVFEHDQVVIQGVKKRNDLINNAKTERLKMAEAHAAYQKDGDEVYLKKADDFLHQAEEDERNADAITQQIQERQDKILGTVRLPASPTSSGLSRPRYDLRSWKVAHPNATPADVDAVKKKYKGYIFVE